MWNEDKIFTVKNNNSNQSNYWIMTESDASDTSVIKIQAESGWIISIQSTTGMTIIQTTTTYRLKSGKRYLVTRRPSDLWLIIYEF